MRLTFSTSDAHTEAATDVVLDAESTVTVGELAAALRVDPAALVPGADPRSEAFSAGVLTGTRLPLGRIGRRDPADSAAGSGRDAATALPVGTVRLEVVGGPFSGDVVGLPAGSTVTVGSADDQLVQIPDPFVAPRHALLTISRDNVVAATEAWLPATAPTMTVAPLTGGTGAAAAAGAAAAVADATPAVIVNGVTITEPTPVGPDDLVQIGSSLLRIGRQPSGGADISPESLGRLAYNRASRIHPARAKTVISLPGDKPTAAERTPLPWLSAMLPVVIGVVMAFAFRQPVMLVMAAASPIMVIGNNVTSRRSSKRSGKRTVEKWRDEVVATRASAEDAAAKQRVRDWSEALDPVAVADIAVTPTGRLWERRRGESDALTVRIGVGEVDLDATYQSSGSRASKDPARVGVSPSPIVVDLTHGVVGIAGPREVTLGIARTMMTSLAVTRSPRDLHLVLLCDQNGESDWSFARWLPHLDAGEAAFASIGNTSESRLARLRELGVLLEARRTARGSRASVEFDTDVVVFLDQARGYRTLPGMVTLLEHGPGVGIHLVAVEDDRARLPQESTTEIVVDPSDPTLGRVESAERACPRVLFDATSTEQADRIARALAPIVHVGGVGDDSLLPASVRFVELLDVDLDDPQGIMARWSFAPRETRAVVGASADGEFALDLAADGPHGLVAGTTGAGKSEFLQTFVISLALANRPDALTFVLVDYKGGSAFADCERLPHTVGLVTNLDGRETERALESLDAELKRRELALKTMAAKDADAAWEKDPEAAAAQGLARLVLVIDEFAELKTELPDFVDGLVRIARVGRSLGVHLILATQRPAGAITPEMQSNTNLRVALRVTDKGDSTDVLGSPEAATISSSTPGRGYARRGVGAAPAGFQTARVAGRRPGVVSTTIAAPRALPRAWRDVGLPVVFPKRVSAQGPVDHDDTDLRALVNVITRATTELGIAKNPSPWLEPLPRLIGLDDLEREAPVVLALEDVPSAQAQRPLTWNVEEGSHLEFIGGARSGRTSSLRALVAQLAVALSPDDLHWYAIDYGNGGLGPLRGLPHCGAVVTPMESGRLTRFVRRLSDEIGTRQNILARDSYGDIREQRAAAPRADRLPFVVVVIDGWERLTSDLGQDAMVGFREEIVRLLREGPAVGIRVIVTGDRALINDKISAFIDTRYLFPMTDREDYRSAGLPVRGLPAEIGPGRVFFGTPLREAQMLLLPGEPTGEAQSAAFRAIVTEVAASVASRDATTSIRPFRVDVLPGSITLDAAGDLPLVSDGGRDGVVVGIGGDDLSRYRIDVEEARGLIVVGDRRSGRSTTLALVVEQLAEVDADGAQTTGLVVVSTRESVLRTTARRLGVPLLTDDSITGDAFEEAIASTLVATGSALVVIDDVEALKDTPLERILMDTRGTRFAFLVSAHVEEAGGLYRGPFTEAKKARTGLLLSATTAMHGTQTFGAPLPRQLQGPAAPGRAALFWDGAFVEVQVPIPADGVTP